MESTPFPSDNSNTANDNTIGATTLVCEVVPPANDCCPRAANSNGAATSPSIPSAPKSVTHHTSIAGRSKLSPSPMPHVTRSVSPTRYNADVTNNKEPLPSTQGSTVRPLRERRLPASFWQEPNVPRIQRRPTAAQEFISRSANAVCDDAASFVCCGVRDCSSPFEAVVAAASDQTIYPLQLLQYIGVPSPTYRRGEYKERPRHSAVSPSRLDLVAFYLSGLCHNTRQQP